MNQTIE